MRSALRVEHVVHQQRALEEMTASCTRSNAVDDDRRRWTMVTNVRALIRRANAGAVRTCGRRPARSAARLRSAKMKRHHDRRERDPARTTATAASAARCRPRRRSSARPITGPMKAPHMSLNRRAERRLRNSAVEEVVAEQSDEAGQPANPTRDLLVARDRRQSPRKRLVGDVCLTVDVRISRRRQLISLAGGVVLVRRRRRTWACSRALLLGARAHVTAADTPRPHAARHHEPAEVLREGELPADDTQARPELPHAGWSRRTRTRAQGVADGLGNRLVRSRWQRRRARCRGGR